MQKNVANFERIASVLMGGLALQQTLSSDRSKLTKAATGSAGLALLWRGLTGSCPVYKRLDIDTSRPSAEAKSAAPTLLERSALVNLPPDEVTAFLETEMTPWGRFTSVGAFQFHIDLGSRTWTLYLSAHADGKRTLIKTSWTDIEADDVPGEYSAHLLDQGDQDAGVNGSILNLRQLKSLLETGEIASIEGQPHGERSSLGSFFENFGDKLLQKIQTKTEMSPSDEAASEAHHTPSLQKEARA